MKFIGVKEVPKKRSYNNLKDCLERFVASGLKVVKIELHHGEYKSATIAANCLRTAVKRHGFNYIKVFQRGDDVYLENDM